MLLVCNSRQHLQLGAYITEKNAKEHLNHILDRKKVKEAELYNKRAPIVIFKVSFISTLYRGTHFILSYLSF